VDGHFGHPLRLWEVGRWVDVVVVDRVAVVAAAVDEGRAGWAGRRLPGLVEPVCAPRVGIGKTTLWACPAMKSAARSVARRWCASAKSIPYTGWQFSRDAACCVSRQTRHQLNEVGL